jgi:hypothetical protein
MSPCFERCTHLFYGAAWSDFKWPFHTLVLLRGQSRLGSHLRAHCTGEWGWGWGLGAGKVWSPPCSRGPRADWSQAEGSPQSLCVLTPFKKQRQKANQKVSYFWKLPSYFTSLFNPSPIYSYFHLSKKPKDLGKTIGLSHACSVHVQISVKVKNMTQTSVH